MNRPSHAGFSLVDMMITVLFLGIVSAAAVPAFMDLTRGMRIAQALREVERELQTARLKAVTSNRPIRVRFNCPAAGEYRMVEVIGTSSVPVTADALTNANRCRESTYPFPASDDNPLTRPNHDGPLRRLHSTLSFGSNPALEFWPDGTVHKQASSENPWKAIPNSGSGVIDITVTNGTDIRKVQVNGLGKIQLVQ